jgi:hypothetical protein
MIGHHVTAVSTSATFKLLHGVLQGSVLFILYTADLLELVKRHQLLPHAYADNTQIYGFYSPSEINTLLERISTCFDSVSKWMMASSMQVIPLKTEVMFVGSASASSHPRISVHCQYICFNGIQYS